MTESFTERFAAGLASYGDRPCIEFEGRWYSGAEVAAYGAAVTAQLDAAGLAPDAPVALVVRNRYPARRRRHRGAGGRRPAVMIYSFQSPEAIAADIERLDAAAVLAEPQDWTDPVRAAAHRSGAAGVALGAEVAAPRRGRHHPAASAGGRCPDHPHQRNHRPAKAIRGPRGGAGAHRVQRHRRTGRAR